MNLKNNPVTRCLQETHVKYSDMDRLKVKEWTKIDHVNTNKRKAEVAITSDKADFRTQELPETERDTV